MECAVQVKVAACELLAQTSFCHSQGLIDDEYLAVLRNSIEEFRKLFVKWVKSFDRNQDTDDGWGLFVQE